MPSWQKELISRAHSLRNSCVVFLIASYRFSSVVVETSRSYRKTQGNAYRTPINEDHTAFLTHGRSPVKSQNTAPAAYKIYLPYIYVCIYIVQTQNTVMAATTLASILTEPCQPLTNFEQIERWHISMRHLFIGYLNRTSITINFSLITLAVTKAFYTMYGQ